MEIIFFQGPYIHNDIRIVFLECVNIGERGWKRYTGPIKILEIGLPDRRLTKLKPPQLQTFSFRRCFGFPD
jgi:hypothetical protein